MADEVPTNDAKNAAQNRGPEDSEFEALLERFCLGDLDEKGWQRLNALISGNPAAAKRYTETAHYCQTLRDEAAGQRGVGLEAIGAMGGTANSAVNKKTSARSLAEEGAESKQRGLSAWIAQLGIAVSLAFFCGWLASGWDRADGREEIAAVSGAVAPDAVASDAVGSVPSVQKPVGVAIRERDRLGRITGLTPVASSDGLLRSMSVGARLSRGEVFQLDSGAARLELGSGCELLVEGPAELSAIDTETVFVRKGRVVVPEGCGLTVQTPIATIESAGAAYAVVAKDHSALVCSIEGELTVRYSPRGQYKTARVATVAAGETLKVGRDANNRFSLIAGEAMPENMLLEWEQTHEHLHDYEKLVLADRPMAYWPLYRVRRHRAVLDLTQNGFDGQAIGNWPDQLSDVHASQPRGAYFDGESYIESDRKPPVDLRTGFTIESWAKVDGGPEYQSVFTSRWVLASNTDQQQCFGFTLYAGADDKWQFWSGSGEYGSPWQTLSGPVAVERHRWTHVTASFDPHEMQEDSQVVSGMVRLYVDGVKVAEADHKMSLEDFEWPARIGAAEFVPKSLTSWLFQGELRDVALYDHVLDPMKISLHAKNGRVAI